MMKLATTLGLSLALAAHAHAQTPPPDDVKVVGTTLTAIRKSPDAYRGVWVRLTVQFASLGKVSNPFFTQFEPSRFANFYCWADEQKIWQREQYEDLFGLLFVNKQNALTAKLYDLKVYQRLEVIGIVRNVFQNKPWIEVTEFTTLDRHCTTPALSHLFRGETHMSKRRWKQAIAELSLAPASSLPDHVLGQIHKNLAMCFLRLGEVATASEHIENAVQLTKIIDPEIRRMARKAKVRPESFLDRTVSGAPVEDHNRPMWEAFESQTAQPGPVPTPGKGAVNRSITAPTPGK